MENINQRVSELRSNLKMNQTQFGKAIGLSTSGISSIENETRKVTDQHIKIICSELNVNELWLRTGDGDMFVQQTEFSLDEYARKNKLSPLEIDIIKSYMEVDASIREGILSHFKSVFGRHEETAATVETVEDGIEAEVEAELDIFRQEMIDEKKGQISSALRAKDIG